MDSTRTSNTNSEPSESEKDINNLDYVQNKTFKPNLDLNNSTVEIPIKYENRIISSPPIVPPRHVNTVVQTNNNNLNSNVTVLPVPVTRSSITKSKFFFELIEKKFFIFFLIIVIIGNNKSIAQKQNQASGFDGSSKTPPPLPPKPMVC